MVSKKFNHITKNETFVLAEILLYFKKVILLVTRNKESLFYMTVLCVMG